MDANGETVEVAEEISMDSLPVAAQRSLVVCTANGTIEKIAPLFKRGIIVAYKAAVKAGRNGPKSKLRQTGVPSDKGEPPEIFLRLVPVAN